MDLVTGPMLRAAAPYARWIDVFCELARRTPSTPTRPATSRAEPRPASACGCMATSSARDLACSWRSSSGRRAPITVPISMTPM